MIENPAYDYESFSGMTTLDWRVIRFKRRCRWVEMFGAPGFGSFISFSCDGETFGDDIYDRFDTAGRIFPISCLAIRIKAALPGFLPSFWGEVFY